MIVDDELGALEVLQDLLEFFGAKVQSAHNGQQALEVVKNESFDLILTDLSMPVMDGWEFTRRLRQNPTTAATPVIAISAHALDEYHQKAMEAGCNGVLTKPIQPETFVSELQEVLANR